MCFELSDVTDKDPADYLFTDDEFIELCNHCESFGGLYMGLWGTYYNGETNGKENGK